MMMSREQLLARKAELENTKVSGTYLDMISTVAEHDAIVKELTRLERQALNPSPPAAQSAQQAAEYDRRVIEAINRRRQQQANTEAWRQADPAGMTYTHYRKRLLADGRIERVNEPVPGFEKRDSNDQVA